MNEVAHYATTTRSASAVWAWVATEAGLARVALTVVALHVVDDSFLQPQPDRRARGWRLRGRAGTRTLAEDLQDLPSPDKWLGFPFLAVKTGAVALFSNTAPPPQLTELVPRIAPTPLFLIWSPSSGGENMNPDYHRLAGEPKQIWAMPGAEHVRGIEAQPREYERRVVGFFDQALSPRTGETNADDD